MQCIIDRRAEFSASHRYWLPELTITENQNLFGACANFPGHGHNYVLYVSLLGEINHYGMVENLSYVKSVIKKEVTSQLDYSYLNEVWGEFQQTLPTTENIARVIWHRLVPYLPLYKIQLSETPYLWADYQGQDMQASLSIKTHFSAAHRLALPELSQSENEAIYGKCARIHGHGHNYHLEITVNGEINARTGMLIDLAALQKTLDEYIVEPMDHTFLNFDIVYFQNIVPTAENIALYIAETLKPRVAALGGVLERVKLIESPNNSAEIFCGSTSVNSPLGKMQQPAFN